MGFLVWMLLACGESVTFEEPEPVEQVDPEAEAGPDGSEKAPELQVPVDARPDEARVEAKAPEPGQAWPPIVVPEGPREREWEWDFKHKGATKVSREKSSENALKADASLEEQAAYEMERQAKLDEGKKLDD